MRFQVIYCCPCPDTDDFAGEVESILQHIGGSAASIYRGTDPAAAKYLTGGPPCYKHTQAWIYANYPPGVANPPGRSTHELFNDGVAYPGAPGARLEYWQCGLDIDDAHVAAFIAEARRRGHVVTVTYPGSAVEYHHVNFRHKPHIKPPFDPIRRHDKGRRVFRLTRRLHYVHRRNSGPYLHHPWHRFTERVEEAVKDFQRDHHLLADGVVGVHTFHQLETTFRHQWRHRHRHRLRTHPRSK